MKKFKFQMTHVNALIILAVAAVMMACEPPVVDPPIDPKDTTKVDTGQVEIPKTEWEIADSIYTVADWTVPSHTAFKIAVTACENDPSEMNIETMRQRIKELVPKTEPYNMVATINGDPATRMAFCWFTNEGVEQGEVQLVAKADATEEDFSSGVMTVPATPTTTKGIRYTGAVPYIAKLSGIKSSVKYKYVSHKALAQGLAPGTCYSWRVGYEDPETHEGHWSPIAQFRTMDANQGEFTFLYMTDSHLMNQEYITHAYNCAYAAALTVPEARFCVFPGDFVEDGTVTNSEWEWERWFEESFAPIIKKMPIVPTDGNHDDSPNINYDYHFNTDTEFGNHAKTAPQFKGITYSFVYGDVLFLVYSLQDWWRAHGSDEEKMESSYLSDDVANWMRAQVAANPDTKYRVTLSHKNIFSGSDHSTDSETPLFRKIMLPVFKECEIDLALQGHDHTYEVIGPVNPDNCTPILSAISDRVQVEVDATHNVTGYEGGTYCVDDGTLYFIGATCGRKRYSPHDRARMETDYPRHKVENYFDLFTGMFGQPGAPSFTKITVREDCIEFDSYTAGPNGATRHYNNMKVVRTKPHNN